MNIVRALVFAAVVSLLVRCGTVSRVPQPVPEPEPVVAQVGQVSQQLPCADAKPEAPLEAGPSFHEQVRELVDSLHGRRARLGGWRGDYAREQTVRQLLALGVVAYPVYEAILSDPESTCSQITGVCEILGRQTENDRSMFVPFLVRRLAASESPGADTDIDVLTRISLLSLLGQVGTGRDAWVLVPIILSDGNAFIQWDATQALAKIGGRRELEAMNTWLTGQNHNDPVIQVIIGWRNNLELRLEAERAGHSP